MHNKGNYKQGVYFIFQIEIVIQLSAPGGCPNGLLYVAPTGFFQWEVPAGSQSEGRQKSDSHNVRQSWKDWGPSLGITALPKHASQFLLARPPSLVRSKVSNNTYVCYPCGISTNFLYIISPLKKNSLQFILLWNLTVFYQER